MQKLLLLTALIGATLISNANAQDTGFYARGGIGQADPNENLLDNDTVLNIGGGWRLTPNFSVEAGYNDFGNFDIKGITTGRNQVSSDSFELGVAAKVPFGESGAFGQARLGLHRWDADIQSVAFGFGDQGTDLYFGVGVGYDFNEQFGFSLNFDRYKIDDLNINRTGLGAEIRF